MFLRLLDDCTAALRLPTPARKLFDTLGNLLRGYTAAAGLQGCQAGSGRHRRGGWMRDRFKAQRGE